MDDVNAGEHHYTKNGVSTFLQQKETRLVHAEECQHIFETVSENATQIGTVVNPSKTHLLCIAPVSSAEVSSYIETNEGRIPSAPAMTLLGFSFSNRPTMAAHVELIKKKVNCRIWLLRHLKQAGISPLEIAKIYCSVIRPVIEYAAPIYHWMLTGGQSDEIEKLQRRAMKIIFGYKVAYSAALENCDCSRLDTRRKEISIKFAEKTAANGSFAHWFPLHDPYNHNIRRQMRYDEERANTDRLLKSSLFSMRRLLNQL